MVQKNIIRYFFTGDEHDIVAKAHGNAKTSTPYKRQVCSTMDKLKESAMLKKPKDACRYVEEQVGGVSDVPSSSLLPRNHQQVANIRRKLPFTSASSADPLLAVADLARTKHSDFIISFQLHPTPLCILGTKTQLDELQQNCACTDGSVLHIDPTFYLGNYFVTPLVFGLKDYIVKRTSGIPTYIGPVLIHHRMDYESYHTFLSQLLGKRPMLRKIRAMGSDGESALCKAIHGNLPSAIHLRCFKHLKDNLQRKLSSMCMDSFSQKEIMADIFGTVIDGIHELSLIDADDAQDFNAKLQSLESRWDKLEMDHRAFKSGENRTPSFHSYFKSQFSNVFINNAIRQPRIQAGMGNPPSAFYNNRSESINRLLKRHVDGKKCSLPYFIDQMRELDSKQRDMMKKAHLHVGEWRSKPGRSTESMASSQPCTEPTTESQIVSTCESRQSASSSDPTESQLSETFDILLQTGVYEVHVLEEIWKKALMLIKTENFITAVPGESSSCRARMVASSSSKTPHHVSPARNNQNKFVCDSNCPRYKVYKFCSHTIAVAEINGLLKAFLKVLAKGKSPTVNLSSMIYHGLPTGAGEKGGRSKPKPRKRAATQPSASDSLPLRQRIVTGSPLLQNPPSHSRVLTIPAPAPNVPSDSTVEPFLLSQPVSSSRNHLLITPSEHPFTLKLLTLSIKVCGGCRFGYNNHNPPHDICVCHPETRQILNRAVRRMMLVGTNVHYHASAKCIKLQCPYFNPSKLVIPSALRNKLLSNVEYSMLLEQEFGIVL